MRQSLWASKNFLAAAVLENFLIHHFERNLMRAVSFSRKMFGKCRLHSRWSGEHHWRKIQKGTLLHEKEGALLYEKS